MSVFPVCISAFDRGSGVCSSVSVPKFSNLCSSSSFSSARVPGVSSQKTFLVDAIKFTHQHSQHGRRQSVIAHSRGRSGRSQNKRGESGLPSSLYVPFEKLPPEGRAIDIADETCNPEERRCRTAIYVWERKCKACYGTGIVTSSSRRGNRTSYACLSCHGLGYVRRASTTEIPDLESGDATTLRRNGVIEGQVK